MSEIDFLTVSAILMIISDFYWHCLLKGVSLFPTYCNFQLLHSIMWLTQEDWQSTEWSISKPLALAIFYPYKGWCLVYVITQATPWFLARTTTASCAGVVIRFFCFQGGTHNCISETFGSSIRNQRSFAKNMGPSFFQWTWCGGCMSSLYLYLLTQSAFGLEE